MKRFLLTLALCAVAGSAVGQTTAQLEGRKPTEIPLSGHIYMQDTLQVSGSQDYGIKLDSLSHAMLEPTWYIQFLARDSIATEALFDAELFDVMGQDGGAFTGQVGTTRQTYSASSGAYTPTFGSSNPNVVRITLDANLTINDPTGMVAGFAYVYELVQDVTGLREVTRGGSAFPDSIVVSPVGNDLTRITCIASSATAYERCYNDSYSRSTLSLDTIMEPDGTNCTIESSARTIGTWAPDWYYVCTDNDASTLYATIQTPTGWDGREVTAKLMVIQDAADTNVLHSDISARCTDEGDGTPPAWGTEVAMDIAALTGSDAMDSVTSDPVTPAGSCNGGDTLEIRWQLDQTGTTTAVATLFIPNINLVMARISGD